jgi:pimeloyl-ACP methyl ester carboxylesterase
MEIVFMIFQVIGIILGVLIGLFVLELAIVAFVPGYSVPQQRLESQKQKPQKADVELSPSKREVSFHVRGIQISAWLYLPKTISAPVPCIIMANGLGGTKDMLLEHYASRYQQAGFAALVFDYRHFGESEGEPRQLIWIPYQLEDYAVAVEYARSLGEVDPSRIALWGTSLSGGHVLVVAARDERIACAVAQCPWLDGFAAARMGYKLRGLRQGLRLLSHGQRDFVRSWFGLSPHKIPIIGKKGTVAVLPFSEAYEAFTSLAPEGFINEVCARILIRMDKYRPIKKARSVRCPVLLQICDTDEPIPLNTIEESARKMGRQSEVKHYPIGHFDIYTGENFERSVNDQLQFLKRHLSK